ncbi:MAG: hypothetical protein KGP27_09890 [Hyphomicrobiales bacterium]|nr:hypothetical protein [Hyphomicrobiales bacterium]
MHAPRPRLAAAASIAILGAILAGCTHPGFGTQELHYATFSVPPPNGMVVHVCHAYGCRMRTRFRFTDKDIADLGELMRTTRGAEPDTPEQERRAIAYAIGWMETRVGNAIGTKDDRPGMDFEGSGDPTQQDCVDEATNTTSYLNVLATAGLIRHHTVDVPFSKENFLRGVAGWTHWTAVIVEKPFAGIATAAKPVKGKAKGTAVAGAIAVPPSSGGQRWAVDSWIYANGENPAIVKAEEWYIASLDALPPPKK